MMARDDDLLLLGDGVPVATAGSAQARLPVGGGEAATDEDGRSANGDRAGGHGGLASPILSAESDPVLAELWSNPFDAAYDGLADEGSSSRTRVVGPTVTDQ